MTRGLELIALSVLALVNLGSTGAISDVYAVDISKDGYEDYRSRGCYVDSKRNRIMAERVVAEPMSAEICFKLCNKGRYTHFGTQHGDECWCAKDPRLTANGGKVSSSECDTSCARSDTREKCGGHDRISVYEMTDKDDDRDDDPKGKSYESEGCYKDSSRNRIMSEKYTDRPMSAEICCDICDDGYYTHFGTQYGRECWCAEDPHLNANGGKVSSRECDMDCAGSRTGEKCGDRNRMSVYKFEGGGKDDDRDDDDDKAPRYIGCYADRTSKRAMPDERLDSDRMTVKMCVAYCSDLGYKYAGAQYGKECWCSNKYDDYGESTRCNMPCAGDDRETCGGRNALSVYKY